MVSPMALTPWSLVRFGRLGLLMLPLLAGACGGHEFHTEREVFAHFKQHRHGFQQAAEVFVVMQTRAVEIPDVVPRENENPLVRLARELRVSAVAVVPGTAPSSEQWVQFRLRQRLLTSTYGLIFVPEGHSGALASIQAQMQTPPHGVRAIRPLDEHWFYFEYD